MACGPENRGAEGCDKGCHSGLYGATESPRREGSAQPGKVREDFPEEGEVSLSLRGGIRIQQQKAVKVL